MTNHPNRSKSSPARNPTKEELKESRHLAGLSQEAAADVVYYSTIAWKKCEAGDRRMHPATFELFRLKTGQLPLKINKNCLGKAQAASES
jgi:hypothetical protein